MIVVAKVEVLQPEAPPGVDAAVFLHTGPVGAHVGVLYRASDEGEQRLVHQAWHHDSRVDEIPVYATESGLPLWWVPPGLDQDELADLRSHAALVARRLRDGEIPYAFDPKDASVRSDGFVSLGRSLGLTCATFVMKVFEFARVQLLRGETWTQRSPERRSEDEAAQRALVGYLHREAPEHAARIEREVGCIRIRAEEVAAASGFEQRPVPFADAEAAGRSLLGAIRAWSPARVG
jgi:hypothetical protein